MHIVCLTNVYLSNVHLLNVHLSNVHLSNVHLSNVPESNPISCVLSHLTFLHIIDVQDETLVGVLLDFNLVLGFGTFQRYA